MKRYISLFYGVELMKPQILTAFDRLVSLPYCAGCQKAYYSTMEAFGKHKRDILVDRVT